MQRLANMYVCTIIFRADGGQWDMVTNLIEKHGVMPKSELFDAAAMIHFIKFIGCLRMFIITLKKLIQRRREVA